MSAIFGNWNPTFGFSQGKLVLKRLIDWLQQVSPGKAGGFIL
jgi:hypothetical protein